MAKIDKTVKKETIYISGFVIVLSVFLELVFYIFHEWDYTVLLGNLLGAVAAILNFFLMGITIQKAVLLDEDAAKTKVKLSQMLRMLMLVIFAVITCVFDCFNLIPFVITLLFPRVAIFFRPRFDKIKNSNN
ncbi:MAG: ATP synthase subunit I [Clostridia bacterium]|nr:ATP synthase subunit I [Clostridia bacterium]